MKKTTGLIIGEIVWTVICFLGWVQAVFYDLPKSAHDLKMYVPTESRNTAHRRCGTA